MSGHKCFCYSFHCVNEQSFFFFFHHYFEFLFFYVPELNEFDSHYTHYIFNFNDLMIKMYVLQALQIFIGIICIVLEFSVSRYFTLLD